MSLAGALSAIALASCGQDASTIGPELGGEASVRDSSALAFTLPIPSLSPEERNAFLVGDSVFEDVWVTAPAATAGRDGLGPLFNATSCSSCHLRDGRGIPPDEDPSALGLVVRLSVPANLGPVDEPVYGGQLQDRAIDGVTPEGRIVVATAPYRIHLPDGSVVDLALPHYTIGDLVAGPMADDVMISPRLAPQLPGVGLLEAIPESTILAAADADDLDGDGISGRANVVTDPTTGASVLGRFGWKANVPTVHHQSAGAFSRDIGITSPRFPDESCTAAQADCLAAPTGGDPEISDRKLDQLAFYVRTLAVPTRRNPNDPVVLRGEKLFTQLGCAACHTMTIETGPADVRQLANQVIHPFTDLLLHDMGPGLADGRPDGSATGTEWRTAPLWGLGLIDTVNGEARYLHDGRARTLHEAILWHGGEASAARDAYLDLPEEDAAAIRAFLQDL